VVALHEKGDFFGEGCLTGQPRRLATVTAITVSEIMRLDKATMVNRNFPSCSYRISSVGMSALKRTWSISCSIRARSVWRGCFY
jgi:CRP-like cAMP-binding protein